MNTIARKYLKAAELIDKGRDTPGSRYYYFYTALDDAGLDSDEKQQLALEYYHADTSANLPTAHPDVRILACCFLAAIAELGE